MGKRSTQAASAEQSNAASRQGQRDTDAAGATTHTGSPAVVSQDLTTAILGAIATGANAAGAIVISPDSLARGDLPIIIDGRTIGGLRITGLEGALDRLVAQIEREIGQPVEALDREGKQAVVHRLDQLGAFTLRKAVEDIADRLHVSRFTVYNYLNSQP